MAEIDENNKIFPFNISVHFNHTYRFPEWNPSNDPSDISLPLAFKIYMHCIISNHFRTSSARYFDGRRRECIVEWNDLMLCLKVSAEKDEDKKRKLLENAYPWLCDSTQGFRHRHVYQFRDRPPPPYDEKDIASAEYEAMRNTTVSFNKGALLSRVYHCFTPYYYHRLAKLSPREFLAYIRPNLNAVQTFKEESAETVELIRTTVKIVSGTEDENLALIDDDKKREIEEVASNVNEIYDIFDVSNASARRKKECEESMQQLLGSDSDIEVSGVINGVESFKIMRKHEDSEVKKLNLKYENSQKSEEKKKIGENIKNKKIFDYFFENKSKKTIKSREPLLSTIWRKGKSSLKIFKEKKEKDYLEKVESEKKNFKIDLLLNKKDDKKENKP